MTIDQLIEELRQYPGHTEVALESTTVEIDEDGDSHTSSGHAYRSIQLRPWNDMGFCVLIGPAK